MKKKIIGKLSKSKSNIINIKLDSNGDIIGPHFTIENINKLKPCEECGKVDYLTEVLFVQNKLPQSLTVHPMDGKRVCNKCLSSIKPNNHEKENLCKF